MCMSVHSDCVRRHSKSIHQNIPMTSNSGSGLSCGSHSRKTDKARVAVVGRCGICICQRSPLEARTACDIPGGISNVEQV